MSTEIAQRINRVKKLERSVNLIKHKCETLILKKTKSKKKSKPQPRSVLKTSNSNERRKRNVGISARRVSFAPQVELHVVSLSESSVSYESTLSSELKSETEWTQGSESVSPRDYRSSIEPVSQHFHSSINNFLTSPPSRREPGDNTTISSSPSVEMIAQQIPALDPPSHSDVLYFEDDSFNHPIKPHKESKDQSDEKAHSPDPSESLSNSMVYALPILNLANIERRSIEDNQSDQIKTTSNCAVSISPKKLSSTTAQTAEVPIPESKELIIVQPKKPVLEVHFTQPIHIDHKDPEHPPMKDLEICDLSPVEFDSEWEERSLSETHTQTMKHITINQNVQTATPEKSQQSTLRLEESFNQSIHLDSMIAGETDDYEQSELDLMERVINLEFKIESDSSADSLDHSEDYYSPDSVIYLTTDVTGSHSLNLDVNDDSEEEPETFKPRLSVIPEMTEDEISSSFSQSSDFNDESRAGTSTFSVEIPGDSLFFMNKRFHSTVPAPPFAPTHQSVAQKERFEFVTNDQSVLNQQDSVNRVEVLKVKGVAEKPRLFLGRELGYIDQSLNSLNRHLNSRLLRSESVSEPTKATQLLVAIDIEPLCDTAESETWVSE